MKIGVLCEFSGVVRDAFLSRGHDAISRDLLPSESPGPHIQGDCLAQDWSDRDLLICHPPCKYLSRAGTWANGRDPERLKLRDQAFTDHASGKRRMVSFRSIANAMAEQWGSLVPPPAENGQRRSSK